MRRFLVAVALVLSGLAISVPSAFATSRPRPAQPTPAPKPKQPPYPVLPWNTKPLPPRTPTDPPPNQAIQIIWLGHLL